MSETSIRLIESLSNANAVSGFEDEILEIIRQKVNDRFKIEEDSLRNLYLYPKKKFESKPVVMIDGHSDEIGFIVQSITPTGMLKFLPLGGWFPQTVMAHKVKVKNSKGQYIPGVIASLPLHFMNPEKRDKVVGLDNMVIDVGASSVDEINMLEIEPGAPVIPDAVFSFDKKRNLMLGKALDNRLGCAAVIETLISVKPSKLNIAPVGTISSQEEIGIRGVQIAARKVKPDVAIIYEGTPADDTFSTPPEAQGAMKHGPQIRHRDNSMVSNPRFVRFAKEIAKQNNIPFQDAVRQYGATDGGPTHLANQGVPTIVIGVPVRYAHTHYGFADLEDYNLAVKWGCEIIKNLNKTVIDSF